MAAESVLSGVTILLAAARAVNILRYVLTPGRRLNAQSQTRAPARRRLPTS